jgi:hypothetical protein
MNGSPSAPAKFREACLRCPMLRMDPTPIPRLLQIEANTRERLEEAHQMQWLGEVSGLQEGLRHIAEKKRQAQRLKELADPTTSLDTLD